MSRLCTAFGFPSAFTSAFRSFSGFADAFVRALTTVYARDIPISEFLVLFGTVVRRDVVIMGGLCDLLAMYQVIMCVILPSDILWCPDLHERIGQSGARSDVEPVILSQSYRPGGSSERPVGSCPRP